MPYGAEAHRLRALKANIGTSRLAGAPSTLYVALLRHPSAPTTTLGTEPTSAGGYARVAVANTDAKWTFAAASASNTDDIRWPSATGLYSSGSDPLNQWAIYDNATGGDVIMFGALSPTVTVTGSGDTPVIPAAALVISQGV